MEPDWPCYSSWRTGRAAATERPDRHDAANDPYTRDEIETGRKLFTGDW